MLELLTLFQAVNLPQKKVVLQGIINKSISFLMLSTCLIFNTYWPVLEHIL